jgi:hypothetical protein
VLGREAAPDLAGLSDTALHHLWEGLLDLPATDLSLLVALPKLIGPDLQRLRESVADDDPDWGGMLSPQSQRRSTRPDNEQSSPTRSSGYAISAASTAGRPRRRSSTSTVDPRVSSAPACSKP